MNKASATGAPYWILVIRHYLKKGYALNGLTLPFLIGARTIVEPHLPLLSIEQILLQAIEHPAGTTILRCGNIGEYVFAELDAESQRYTSHYPHVGQLYFTDYSFQQTQDVAKLINDFTSLYADYLQQQRYSREAGEWRPFSSTDLSRLREIAHLS